MVPPEEALTYHMDTSEIRDRLGVRRPSQAHPSSWRNVGDRERMMSTLGGGALAAIGLSRRSPLGMALAALGGVLMYRGVSGHCPAYRAMGVTSMRQGGIQDTKQSIHNGVHVERSITVDKPIDEIYRFWRNFENLPRFMQHLHSVKDLGAGRSHWVARAPAGREVEWDAEIINEKQNELIAWRSLEGADVDNAGSVRFRPAPQGRGTEIRVSLQYHPPAGKLGATLAKLFGEAPEQQILDDLRRFKQVMETGDLATTQGQPRGTCS